MALSAKSLFTYKIEVTTLNQNLDFVIELGGDTLTAVLDVGFYSPTSLAQQIAYQMQSLDTTNIYTVSVSRNVMGNTQNRITIATNGAYLDLLFGTGPNTNTSCASLIGFNPSDYTGATSYIGSSSTGSILIPNYLGFNFLDVNNGAKVFGAVNVAASGLKEAVTFNIQQFIEVEYRYEVKSRLTLWTDFFSWAQAQKPFDFTPEISDPDTFYTCTLEKTSAHSQGLGWRMPEMLPALPNHYTTGPLTFRVTPDTSAFVAGA